jgi:hypothetical protein
VKYLKYWFEEGMEAPSKEAGGPITGEVKEAILITLS